MCDLTEQKKALRKLMLAKRKTLASRSFDPDIFLSHHTFAEAVCVAGYWPLPGELDIRPLLKCLSSVCLPVVIKEHSPLVFRCWQEGEELIDGPHGTRHPCEQAADIVPDLVLVPLLAFDKNGGRLGFGAGYYDRTLANLPALRVGIGFDEQEVDQVPMGRFDQRLDWIVTPTRVIRCAET